jgi:hypothetical protein
MKIILLPLLITSCCYPPCFDKFTEIYHTPAVLHEYDCSEKSRDYLKAIREAGYEGDIVTVDHDGPNRTLIFFSYEKQQFVKEVHDIVRVHTPRGHLYCDPTNNKWSFDICDFAPECERGIKRVSLE